eukprot:1650788-Rhodomonas_salina.1
MKQSPDAIAEDRQRVSRTGSSKPKLSCTHEVANCVWEKKFPQANNSAKYGTCWRGNKCHERNSGNTSWLTRYSIAECSHVRKLTIASPMSTSPNTPVATTVLVR